PTAPNASKPSEAGSGMPASPAAMPTPATLSYAQSTATPGVGVVGGLGMVRRIQPKWFCESASLKKRKPYRLVAPVRVAAEVTAVAFDALIGVPGASGVAVLVVPTLRESGWIVNDP